MNISIKEFRRLMHCGHGRCFWAMEQGDPETYRKAVLYGCLHDIAFDMQCEGSRGIFMYNLAQYYPDPDSFAEAAAESFRKLLPDMDEHRFQHLCDFLMEFAVDGNKAASSALEEKYSSIFPAILHARQSRKLCRMLTNYEYLCILLMQHCDDAHFLKIISDIGIYFDPVSAHRELGWFLSVLKQDAGKMRFLENLYRSGDASVGVRAFMTILDTDDAQTEAPRPRPEPLTAEDILYLAQSGTLTPAHRRRFTLRKDASETVKLAALANSVTDSAIRARLWMMFDTKYNLFPLPPDKLLADAISENEELRRSARAALCHVQNPAVRTFAKQLLAAESLCPDAIQMLIANYQPEDAAQLLEILYNIPIDKNEESGWHSIVMSILDHAERMPDAALSFIYENSFCSCCRESALCNTQERNMLTPEIQWECAHDCNPDIRETYGKSE